MDNSKKRTKEEGRDSSNTKKKGNNVSEEHEVAEEFEDMFEDEYDSDDAEEFDEEDDGGMVLNVTDKMEVDQGGKSEKKTPKKEEKEKEQFDKDWTPVYDREKLGPGEHLEYDSSAYEMFHSMSTEWPCLSFDVIPDKLGLRRVKYPHSAYFVAGTQADLPQNNKILLLKMSHMNKTNIDSDSEDEENGDDDDPELDTKAFPHEGGVNRIRCMPQEPHIVASWSDAGFVGLWNINQHLKALDVHAGNLMNPDKIFKVPGHKTEGFSMDWSPVKTGRLITGDCDGKIYMSDMRENGSFESNSLAFGSHKDSVEDLQWSPSEETVFASCSVDKTIKIWDIREKQHKSAYSWEGGASDINVISWGRKTVFLLVSGGDDGALRVWDLRSLKNSGNSCDCVAHFKWHKKAITSVSWDPFDESVFTASSEDDQITIWDLSTERDEDEAQQEELANIPPQLLFIHQNQTDIKEIRYHPQIPGVVVSTAAEGFDIFQANLQEKEDSDEEED